MSHPDKIHVKTAHKFNVTAERVYDCIMDVKKAKSFMFATPTGKMVKAEIDAKVGGGFVFVEKRPTGTAEHYGKYLTLNRPTQIAFQFAVQKDAPTGDLVTIDIKTLPQGCQVTLTHEMDAEFEHIAEKVEEGWDGILDGLGMALRK
jgi:uncharacterized protein YndB with AHSA1/START domain